MVRVARPDWRVADEYRSLDLARRQAIAWEWLRRDPDYVEAAQGKVSASDLSALGERPAQRAAECWGLVAFEDPALGAGLARPVWTRQASDAVLLAEAGEGEGDAFDLRRFAALATLVTGEEDYLLLSDGIESIRLDARGTRLCERPTRLRYQLVGFSGAATGLETLRSFLFLHRNGRLPRLVREPRQRAARRILVLRTADAMASGASQRDIAAGLFDERLLQTDWRTEAESVRSAVRRLVTRARIMERGGWRDLLRTASAAVGQIEDPDCSSRGATPRRLPKPPA